MTTDSAAIARSRAVSFAALGLALGMAIGVAASAVALSSRDGPRSGLGWVQVGRLGGDRVAIVDVVPFGPVADRNTFSDAINTLCPAQVARCLIAFEFLSWRASPNHAALRALGAANRGGDEPALTLLGFYRRELDGTGTLSIDCGSDFSRQPEALFNVACLPRVRG